MSDIERGERLRELRERVHAAKGPDRELDVLIAQELVPDVLVLRQRKDDSGADPYTYWKYTGSIDAAVALVERLLPGWCWDVSSSGQAWVMGVDSPMRDHFIGGSPDKPPLALLDALLSTLLAQAEAGPTGTGEG